jgi:hypothetical protein
MKSEFPNQNNARNLWPYGIILTFILFISATVGLVVMACAQKADLVSPDYYEQEIRFQSHLDRTARTETLGALVSYRPDIRKVWIELPKSMTSEKPVGQISLYRPSAAGLDRHIPFEPDAQGIQVLDASALAPGFWKVRVAWTSAGQDYFLERSINVR